MRKALLRRDKKNIFSFIAALIAVSFFLFSSCKLSGWDADLDDFVSRGLARPHNTDATITVTLSTNDTSYTRIFSSANKEDTVWIPYGTVSIDMTLTSCADGGSVQCAWKGSSLEKAGTDTAISLRYDSGTPELMLSVSAPDGHTTASYTISIKQAQAIADGSALAGIGTDTASLAGQYVLTSDIDLSALPNWTPLGSVAGNTPFTGILDGGGHTITNLSSAMGGGDGGFFAYVKSPAVISNVRLTDVCIQGNSSITDGTAGDGVGALVGENYGGIIRRCSIAGSVTGYRRVGGLVGNNRAGGTITECFSSATVTSQDGSFPWAYSGGLVGSNWGTISDSYARCAVRAASPAAPAGGFLGSNEGGALVERCYASGTSIGGTSRGFLVVNSGSVADCFYDGTVSALSDSMGASPLTSAEMKKKDSYPSWDFSGVWNSNATINGGYPYLRNNAP